MATDLHQVRDDYAGVALPDDITTVDPWVLFEGWIEAALAASVPEPTAMSVATVRPDGRPESRIVLLKDYSPDGLVFFTNYDSAKGRDVAHDPVASALLWWPALFRQVKAIGSVERLDRAASEEYFHSRPRASQVSAAVSRQSSELGSRAQLEAELAEATLRFGDDEVPLPDNWGGLRIRVDEFEFWQGMPSRVHDRARFTRTVDGWSGTRLYP